MNMSGSRIIECGPVTLACMSPEASDKLDAAVAEWERQRKQEAVETQQSVYQTLYWYFRWSGLVDYGKTL